MPWHQINTRRICLQMCLFWNDGLNKKEYATYGLGIKNFLNFFDGRKTEYYVDAAEWERYRAGQRALLNDPHWITTLPWEAQKFLEKQLTEWRAAFPANLPDLSNAELLAWQQKVAEAVGWTNSRTWMIYLINDVIADRVREELNKRLAEAAAVDKYLLSFSTPLELNEAMKERVALLRLSLERPRLSPEEFKTKLRAHAKRFEFIPMFGFDHDPHTVADFERELENFANPAAELKELEATMRARQETFARELQELGLKEADYLYQLIQMLKHTVFVRDYRDTLRQQMYLLDRYLYEEIGRRLGGLSVVATTNLTNEELAAGLQGELSADALAALAAERAIGFLVIERDYKREVYSGAAAFARATQELGTAQTKNVIELRGTSASPGRAQGPARLIETNQDLPKVQPGDIMITHVTRQDFVPAMRRSAAVVTDEGGITNHAAIVCREFGLPCVVGTKHAVKTFQDGELVEVDADKGIIRRL